jgi:hypothetical protein
MVNQWLQGDAGKEKAAPKAAVVLSSSCHHRACPGDPDW